MSRYTPKAQPWQSTRGYEKIKAYPVLSIPETITQCIPSYVPDELTTAHLTFPNLVTGYNQIPFHAADEHYSTDQWTENRKKIQENAEACLDNLKPIKDNLEKLVRQKKKQLEESKEKLPDISNVKSRIEELSPLLEKTINKCNEMQDLKRRLEALARNIEAPLQISQECLHHREQKDKSELVDDEVEKLLVQETQIFCQSIQKLKECLTCCENQLLNGRKHQCDLESCIKKGQWATYVDQSKEAIDRILESNSWTKQADCLKSKTCSVIAHMDHNKKEAIKNIEQIKSCISDIWKETNDAFAKRYREIECVKYNIEASIAEVNHQIVKVEKNIKYLEAYKDKEMQCDIMQGKKQIESLLAAKKALDSDLSAKVKSLFIDKHGCMTMRKSFPISIVVE